MRDAVAPTRRVLGLWLRWLAGWLADLTCLCVLSGTLTALGLNPPHHSYAWPTYRSDPTCSMLLSFVHFTRGTASTSTALRCSLDWTRRMRETGAF